jgi:SOS response regulatory protein OraA/RecX
MPEALDPEREVLELFIRLLARRSHNRAELRRKARQRGHEEAAIDGALTRAEELHVLESEADSAARFAEERSRRRGATPRAVEAKLLERGYASDIARGAVTDVFSTWDARAAARDVLDSEREPARAARKLQRLGFDADVIGEVVSHLRGAEEP